MANSKFAIGIDLGTTNSCVAVFRYGKTEIIPNDLGYPTTPSIVAFTEKEKFVGNAAKDQKLENQENTVYDVKRIIGRQFTDPTVKTDVKNLPVKVTSSEGKPLISVTYKKEEYKFFPEEISAAVLTKMKKIAEDYVGTSITDAVITVPAYFNNSQRQATKDAGQIAGLNVIRMINEPTAAAIAYGMDKMSEGEKNILIFDLGGGTFDVSILTIESGNFEVKATAGDTHLGGIDFDRRMVEFVTDEIRVLHKRDLSQNKKAIGRLLDACEKAKCELSEKTEAFISVPSLFGESEDFNFKITRAKFEQICMDMFESTTDPVKKALGFAKMHKVDIDEVILVGGSTHIPMIQKLLSDFFDGKELNKSISPDEAVAYGAAMQAASLNGHLEVQDLLLLDVIPLSLGMREEGGIMSIFFERNSIVPMKRTQIYSTSKDDQTSVDVLIYEGESDLVDKNHLLGHFKLTDIPKAARRIPKIEVTFEIDTSGLLTVTAIDTSTKNQNKITIKKDQRHLTTEQINEALKRAENFLDDDQKNYEQILEKNKLRELAYQYITSVNEASFISRMSEAERKQVSEKAEKVLKWIKENYDATKDEIQRERKSLESTAIPVIEKFKEISRSNSNNRKPKPGPLGGPSAGSSAVPSTGFSSGQAANRPSTSNNTQNPGKPRTGPIIREKN